MEAETFKYRNIVLFAKELQFTTVDERVCGGRERERVSCSATGKVNCN